MNIHNQIRFALNRHFEKYYTHDPVVEFSNHLHFLSVDFLRILSQDNSCAVAPSGTRMLIEIQEAFVPIVQSKNSRLKRQSEFIDDALLTIALQWSRERKSVISEPMHAHIQEDFMPLIELLSFVYTHPALRTSHTDDSLARWTDFLECFITPVKTISKVFNLTYN